MLIRSLPPQFLLTSTSNDSPTIYLSSSSSPLKLLVGGGSLFWGGINQLIVTSETSLPAIFILAFFFRVCWKCIPPIIRHSSHELGTKRVKKTERYWSTSCFSLFFLFVTAVESAQGERLVLTHLSLGKSPSKKSAGNIVREGGGDPHLHTHVVLVFLDETL